MRRTARNSVGALLSPVAAWRRRDSRRVVVLLYHSVHPTRPGASATPELFAEHLDWLRTHCEMIRLSEIRRALDTDARLRPAVAITFDDGYVDNLEHAAPCLSERGLSATFFLCTGLVDRVQPVVRRLARLQDLKDRDVVGLTWEQVSEMRSSGMEIGAHTVTHPNLAILPRGVALEEIHRSKRNLEDRLGEPITAFAYPFGKPRHHFTAETEEVVAEAGFEQATSVLFRSVRPDDGAYRIPRFAVSGDSLPELQRKVWGRLDGIGVWQETAPRWMSHFVSPARSHRGELSGLIVDAGSGSMHRSGGTRGGG